MYKCISLFDGVFYQNNQQLMLCINVTGPHGLAMLSANQLPVGYSNSMTSVQSATWAGDVGGGVYRCVRAGRQSRSPPYPVGRGPGGGSTALPSPAVHSSVAASSFGVGGVPTTSVYHVDTGRSCAALHSNLALKVDTDDGT